MNTLPQSTGPDLYGSVMDPDSNPLRVLPVQQKLQAMVALGVMWTLIFTVSTGAWLFYGYLLAAHILVPLGLLVTGVTFKLADKSGQVASART